MVLDDLLPEEAAIFDEFEDDEYDKRLVRPRLVGDFSEDPLTWVRQPAHAGDGGEEIDALAYVWTEESSLEDVAWVPERDFEPYEREYVEMCGSFVEEELPEELRSWRRGVSQGTSPPRTPEAAGCARASCSSDPMARQMLWLCVSAAAAVGVAAIVVVRQRASRAKV